MSRGQLISAHVAYILSTRELINHLHIGITLIQAPYNADKAIILNLQAREWCLALDYMPGGPKI